MSEQGECSISNNPIGEKGSDSTTFDLKALHNAVNKGNARILKTLLKTQAHSSSSTNAGIWGRDKNGSTALHVAAAKGHEDILDMLLGLHPDVNIQDGKGKTPLNILSELNGLPEQSAVHIVKRFLEEGADPRIPNQSKGRNCLHTAASVGNVQIIRCLLDPQIYGSHTEVLVDINAVVESGQTALHLAVEGSRFDGREYALPRLLRRPPDFNAVELEDREDVLMELLRHSPDVNVVDNKGKTALHIYLSQKNGPRELQVVGRFLQLGADMHIVDSHGRTCLHVAVLHNKPDVVRCLLDRDDADLPQQTPDLEKSLIDINAVDKDGLTALQLALASSQQDLLMELLRHNPDVNIVDGQGNPALHIYLSQDNGSRELEVVRKFLELGADLQMVDLDRRTCLHVAVLHNKENILKCLLDPNDHDLPKKSLEKSMVNINAVDKDGMTALHLAAVNFEGTSDILGMILDHNPDVNIRNPTGDTAFGIYFRNAKKETYLLKAFLQHGTNPNLRGSGCLPCLHAAIRDPGVLCCLLDLSNYNKPEYHLDPNEFDAEGFTPLHHAVGSSSSLLLELDLAVNELLNNGADPNIRTRFGWFDLNYITGPNRRDVIGIRDLARCFRVVDRARGLTALHIAAANGYNGVVGTLLKHGADVAARDNLGMTPLMLYIKNDSVTGGILEKFRQCGDDLNVLNRKKQNLLHVAAKWGSRAAIGALLRSEVKVSSKFDINAVDEDGSTALHLAAICKHDAVLEELLAHNPDVNIRDQEGNTALILYCGRSLATLHIVKKFIGCGANLQILNEDGQGCLHATAAAQWRSTAAAQWGWRGRFQEDFQHARFVRGLMDLLVSERAKNVVNVNAADVHGSTPRLLAAAFGAEVVLEELCNWGHDSRLSSNYLLRRDSIKEAKERVKVIMEQDPSFRLGGKYLRYLHVDSVSTNFVDRDPWLVLLNSKGTNMKPTDDAKSVTSPSDAPGKSTPSEMTLRSDAVALGFKGFSDPFDGTRTLVVVVKSSEGADTVEISFLHPEGMASLIGVGVPFSKVVLRSRNTDGSIEVQEIGETAWRALWISSPKVVGSLAVCDARVGIKELSQEGQGSDGGKIDPALSSKNQELSAFGYPQSFLFPFPDALFSWGLIARAGSNTGLTSSSSNTTALANNGLDQTSGSGISGANRIATAERDDQSRENESEQMKLIVKIRLNPRDFTLSKVEDENNSILGDMIDKKYHPQLEQQTMEPILEISFFQEGEGDQIVKTFSTTLAVTFYMHGNEGGLDDRKRFGWYQNELLLSFGCSEIDAVTIERRNETANAEERLLQEVHGRNQSKEKTTKKKADAHVQGGGGGVGVGGGIALSRGKAVKAEEEYQQIAQTEHTYVKNTKFVVLCQGDHQKIASRACLEQNLNVLDPSVTKSQILHSGIINTVYLVAEGQWNITDNISTCRRFCKYEFTGRRSFHLEVQNEISTGFFSRLKSLVVTRRPVPKTLKTTQETAKHLFIDHSFSHFERLRRRDPYTWHLSWDPRGPGEVSKIINTSSTSSSNPSSSSSNTNVP